MSYSLFEDVQTDPEGYIGWKEFWTWICQKSHQISYHDARKLFRTLDRNGDKRILPSQLSHFQVSGDIYSNLLSLIAREPHLKDLDLVFDQMDDNNSNYVTRIEFLRWTQKNCNGRVTTMEAEELFNQLDVNGSDQLTRQELATILNPEIAQGRLAETISKMVGGIGSGGGGSHNGASGDAYTQLCRILSAHDRVYLDRLVEQTKNAENQKYRKVFTELDIEYTGSIDDVLCRLKQRFDDIMQSNFSLRRQLDNEEQQRNRVFKNANDYKRLCSALDVYPSGSTNLEDMVLQWRARSDKYEELKERAATERMELNQKLNRYKTRWNEIITIIDMQDGVAGNVGDQIREMKRRADMLDGVEGNFRSQMRDWENKVRHAQSWKKKYDDLVAIIDMQDGIAGNVEDQIREMKRRADSIDGLRNNWEQQKREWERRAREAQSYKRKYDDLVAIIDMQDGVAGNVEDQIHEMKRRADAMDGQMNNWKQQKAKWEVQVRQAQSYKKKYEDLVLIIDMQDGVAGNVEDQIREMKRRADELDGMKGNWEQQRREWERQVRHAQQYKQKYEELVNIIDMQDGVAGNVEEQIMEMKRRADSLDGLKGNWEQQKREWERQVRHAQSYKQKYEDLVRIIDMQDGVAGNVEEQIRDMKRRADSIDGIRGNFEAQKREWDQRVKRAQEWRAKYEDLVTLIDMQDGIGGNVEDQIREMKHRADMLDGVQGNLESQKRQWQSKERRWQSDLEGVRGELEGMKAASQKYAELLRLSNQRREELQRINNQITSMLNKWRTSNDNYTTSMNGTLGGGMLYEPYGLSSGGLDMGGSGWGGTPTRRPVTVGGKGSARQSGSRDRNRMSTTRSPVVYEVGTEDISYYAGPHTNAVGMREPMTQDPMESILNDP